MTTEQEAKFYRDKHVLERKDPLSMLHESKEKAVKVGGISPKNYDLIMDIPEKRRQWFKLSIELFQAYNYIQMHDLLDAALIQGADKQDYSQIFTDSCNYKSNTKGKARALIDEKLKITEVAKKYGLEVKKNKAVCPFHNDTDPSLSFNDEKNVFYCFGCHAKGDIITFIQMMEDRNNG